MKIRKSKPHDLEDVRGIYLSAFSEAEREMVSQLAVQLICEESNPASLSLVVESEGGLAAHIAFTPVAFDNIEKGTGYILAPLAVKPPNQKQGFGSKLIKTGIQQLAKMNTDLVFVYGDPSYYGRFGFEEKIASAFKPPYKLQYPFGWQALKLNERDLTNVCSSITCVPALMNPLLW